MFLLTYRYDTVIKLLHYSYVIFDITNLACLSRVRKRICPCSALQHDIDGHMRSDIRESNSHIWR